MADVTVTTTGVLATDANTVTARGTAGATITAGQALWYDSSVSQLKPAQATNQTQMQNVVGIALNGGSTGQPIVYASAGNVTIPASANALVKGNAYVVSAANAGGIAPVADPGTGTYITLLGLCTATNVLTLNITAAGVLK